MELNSPIKVLTIGDISIDWIIDVENVNNPIKSLWLEATEAISTRLGGGGTIFSIAARSVGFESHLIGKVGDDPSGIFAREFLKRNEVCPHVYTDSQRDTGKVLILRDAYDQKAMISHRGANVSLSPSEVDTEIIKGCALIYISGYALLEQPQSISCLKAMRVAKGNNAFTVLDVVPHRIFSIKCPEEYIECLALADSIVLELGTARKMLNMIGASPNAILDQLLLSYKLVMLRTNNDTEIIACHDFRRVKDTGYSKADNKVGFLDRFAACTLHDYLTGKFH